MQQKHGHAAWTGTHSMYWDMKHGHEHTASTHGLAEWTSTCCMSCPCPRCMSMIMLHVHDHAACPSPCCMSMSILHVYAHAARPCQCCMSVPMLNFHAYACPSTCADSGIRSTHRNMQQGLSHVAWTLTFSMSMDTDFQHEHGH